MKGYKLFTVICVVLYGGIALADKPSPSALDADERARLHAMLPEDMKKLRFYDEPRPFRDKNFLNAEGDEIDLHAFDGGLTLVNFWAIWCAPCRKELPNLDRLQGEMGQEGLTVAPISLDRGGLPRVEGFYKKAGFAHLPIYSGADGALARQMGVVGLPVTAILGPDGREVGRLIGGAEWDSDSAQEMLRALLNMMEINSGEES